MPAPDGYHQFKVTGSGGGSGASMDEHPIELLDIYPNPASAITVIPVHSNYHITDCSIALLNALGQEVELIYNGELKAGDKNFFIDASQYAAGMYQVMIQMNDYRVYKKLVIE
jgi:hypothetical protein